MSPSTFPVLQRFVVAEEDLTTRLDLLLVRYFPEKTRNYFQKILKDGLVTVNGKQAKSSTLLQQGQTVEVAFPALKPLKLEARDIPLSIVFENQDLLVINKPAGLVTHPGVGQTHIDDSLVNALLHHCQGQLSGISGVMRPGIVHRLDKDTSGLLLVAKNDLAHQSLSDQLKQHQIEKTYFALLSGHLEPFKGSIDAPIGRSNVDRKKMAVVSSPHGKASLTHYEVLKYFRYDNPVEKDFTFVRIRLITGRTHQIRVHFSSIGFPLVGDVLYGKEKLNNFFEQEFGFRRQFLHAGKISFALPMTSEKLTFEAPFPHDLEEILTAFGGVGFLKNK